MAAKPALPRQQKHLAVLIDADNASAAIVEGLFEEIAKYGIASVKRIYGDWTGPQLGGWKKVLLDYSMLNRWITLCLSTIGHCWDLGKATRVSQSNNLAAALPRHCPTKRYPN